MSVSGDVLVSVMEGYKKEFLDGNYNAVPLIDHWKRVGGLQKESGRVLAVPLQLAEHSSVVDIVTGTENFSLSTNRIGARGVYDWSRGVEPIVLTDKDKTQYDTDAAVFKFVQKLLENAHETMLRSLNLKIIKNAGSAWSELATFNGMSTGGNGPTLGANGIFRPAAFGSQTGTLGGIERSLHPTSYQHQFQDVVDDFSANGRNALNKLMRQCKRASKMGNWADVVLMSDEGFANLAATLQSNERYMDVGDLTKTGSRSLMFLGVPVEYEPDLPTSATDNEEVTAYVLNLKAITLNYTKWFELSKWVDLLPAGFDGEGCLLRSEVAIGVEHLPSSGVLVDGNTD